MAGLSLRLGIAGLFFAFGDGEAFFLPLSLAGETMPPFSSFLLRVGGILVLDVKD